MKQGTLAGIAVSMLFAMASHAGASTLTEQYANLLGNKCSAMNFARNAQGGVAAGQATGSLLTFCNGVAASNDPRIHFLDSGWIDPIQLSGPGLGEFATTLPDWRNRGNDAANTNLYFALRPGTSSVDAARYEDSGADLNFGAVLGGTRWIGDTILISASAGIRDNGHGLTSSVVWTPTERSYLEALVAFDRASKRIEREIYLTPPTPSSVPLEYGYTRANITLESIEGALSLGRDWTLGGFTIGPRLGLQYRKTEQSGHAEQLRSWYSAAPKAPTLTFDDSTQESLSHYIGIRVQLPNLGIRPELEIGWHHDYLDVEREITAHFSEDLRSNPTTIGFFSERDRDSLSARLGFVFPLGSALTIFMTGQFHYSETLHELNGVAGIRWKF